MKSGRFASAYLVVAAAIILAAGLTWILPAGGYDYKEEGSGAIISAEGAREFIGSKPLYPVAGTYRNLPSRPQGLIAILSAPLRGIFETRDIILFVLVIGGFMGVVAKTGALEAGITAIISILRGKEPYLIALLMCLMALGGVTFSMGEETFAFYPLLIAVMVSAGYDSALAFLILLLGSQTGCLAALVSPFSVGIASHIVGVRIGEGIGLRLAILTVVLAINIFIVLSYARRVKKDRSFSLVAPGNEMFAAQLASGANKTMPLDQRRKPVLVIFFAAFAIYTYGVLPLNEMGITFLPTAEWSLKTLSAIFGVAALAVGIFYKMKGQVVKSFWDGAYSFLGVAVIIGLVRGITVIMREGLVIDTIIHWSSIAIAEFSSWLCLSAMFFVYMILSFFIPSTSGLACLSMPIMAPLGELKGIPRDLVVTVFMAASGIVNFITPTSAVVMGGLVVSKVSYGKFFKFIAPRLIVIILATILMLTFGLFLRR